MGDRRAKRSLKYHHWPFANIHTSGLTVDSPIARDNEDRVESWLVNNCNKRYAFYIPKPTTSVTSYKVHAAMLQLRSKRSLLKGWEVYSIAIKVVDVDALELFVLSPTVPKPTHRIIIVIFILKVLPPWIGEYFH
jgi:hypothetical protein